MSSTTFEAELPIGKIHAHPKNPRRDAVADDDMVASIREAGVVEPVIVAPHPDHDGDYWLLAGHRRLDGATKAKRPSVPAVIRTDLVTEGQQIEMMVIENGHREDLTPIEEAEAYQQLELLGYKPASIAAAVGRNVKTVRSRLGLLKLSEKTQGKVHEGQLNLEDALAMAEYSDDPELTARLEMAAAAGNLRYELGYVRQARERERDNAVLVATLLDAGATLYELPEGADTWKLYHQRVIGRVANRPEEWEQHGLCLGYFHSGTGAHATIAIVCNNPANHEDTSPGDGAAAAAEAAREAERAARDEAAAQDRAAAAARTTALMELLGTNTKLPTQLADLVRVFLPSAIWNAGFHDETWTNGYQEILDLPEDDRWRGWTNAQRDVTLLEQHRLEIADAGPGKLTRMLAAYLLAAAEVDVDQVANEHNLDVGDVNRVRAYMTALDQAGHIPSGPDQQILTRLDEFDQATEDGAA